MTHSPTVPLSLSFDRYEVRLRLSERVEFPFFHGGVIRGLVKTAMGWHEDGSDAFPRGVVPFACESGRVHMERGDAYRFLLTLVGEDRPLAKALESKLADHGHRPKAPDREADKLGENYALEAFQLVPPAWPTTDSSEASESGALALRFLSPVLLEPAPEPGKRKVKRCITPEEFSPGLFFRRLRGRLEFLATRLPVAGRPPQTWLPPNPDGVGFTSPGLFEADLISGPKEVQQTGLLGRVDLFQVPPDWLPWLWLGQHLHVGKAAHFGLGRYLLDPVPEAEWAILRPTESLLDRVLRPQAWETAAKIVLANAKSSRPEVARDAPRAASRVRALLREGRYRCAPYHGVKIPKETGGSRQLAIPSTLEDKLAQTAVQEILGPPMDALMEECALAYRKGKSRLMAKSALEEARRRGTIHILRGDIHHFFDALPWERLEAKLSAFFPHDPLLPVLSQWLRADVEREGKRLTRTSGIAQGAPISPLLSNFFLDEFDEAMMLLGFRLVRFADDFVVECPSQEVALLARASAQEVLARLGLSLHAEKTAVTSFKEGFRYLGYWFSEEEARDLSKKELAAANWPSAQRLAAARWVARHSNAGEQETREGEALMHGEGEAGAMAPLALIGESLPAPALRSAFTVLTPYTQIWLRADNLVLHHEDKGLHQEIPLRTVRQLTLVGPQRPSLPCLLALAEAGIPVLFCRSNGDLLAHLGGAQADWSLWAAQSVKAADPVARLAFARGVVQAKLANYATLVVEKGLPRKERVAREIRGQVKACEGAADVEALMGHEGAGARAYFAALKAELDPAWGFERRQPRPAPDGINAMLSFGHSLMANHCSTALIAAGLNPAWPFFHSPQGNKLALAWDLQEEFRFLVDRMVLALIRRSEIKPSDFGPAPAEPARCRMDTSAVRTFMGEFEARMLESFTPKEGGPERTYRQCMDDQAWALREWVEGKRDSYTPFRWRR
jgi:group II intron reverse transcriptase/maturase/CRISPR-associated endonuclease Cas1